MDDFFIKYDGHHQILMMMIGLPGSGKSYLAKRLRVSYNEHTTYVSCEEFNEGNMSVFSSDDLRQELYGDASKQGDNNKLFSELHNRIKNALMRNENVVYDATNLNKKQRKDFLASLKNFKCLKIAMPVMALYETCIKNNKNRKRVVPEDVIRRMYLNWQPPHQHEGFDSIVAVYNDKPQEVSGVYKYFPWSARYINQQNHHHQLTLGDHCKEAYKYSLDKMMPSKVSIAAIWHDVGKIETKTYINAKGYNDGDCHYYQHHCVGAYIYMLVLTSDVTVLADHVDTIDIANMIYFHMHPYNSWKHSERAKERDLLMIGTQMYNNVMLLHECDMKAH